MNIAKSKMRIFKRQFLFIGIAAAAGALVACGGGGGNENESSGISGESGNITSRGSIDTVVSGAISGFGSIIVNGLRIDDSSAQITLDDNSGSNNDLKLGMIVNVGGKRDENGPTGKADHISSNSYVQGPVVTTASGNQFNVLGITVTVNSQTLYDGISGFGALTTGTIVEVYGMPNASGGVTATRIERKLTSEVRLTGTVQNVTSSTFQVNGINVLYQASVLDNITGGITNGMLVRIKGSAVNPTSVTASRIRPARLVPSVRESQEMEIKGIVTRFASITDFDVSGQPVTLASGAEVKGTVALNLLVEVEGTMKSGVLVAREVKRDDDSKAQELELHSVIANIDTRNKTFTVRNGSITVQWDTSTEFKDLAQGEISLINNLMVEVKGQMSGNVLHASRIKREN